MLEEELKEAEERIRILEEENGRKEEEISLLLAKLEESEESRRIDAVQNSSRMRDISLELKSNAALISHLSSQVRYTSLLFASKSSHKNPLHLSLCCRRLKRTESNTKVQLATKKSTFFRRFKSKTPFHECIH